MEKQWYPFTIDIFTKYKKYSLFLSSISVFFFFLECTMCDYRIRLSVHLLEHHHIGNYTKVRRVSECPERCEKGKKYNQLSIIIYAM
jgi:hypothetical protein